MTAPTIAAYVIGQTPRLDLTDGLASRFPTARFEVMGALDDIEPSDVAKCESEDYPLETRMRDGERIVVGASFLSPLLQRAIDRTTGVAAHLVLCAGPFDGLVAPKSPLGSPPPLIRPFETGVAEFERRGFGDLEVLVPFAAQVGPAKAKWVTRGFTCRVQAFSEKPSDRSLPGWAEDLVGGSGAEALVFDYVGFPSDALRDVAARINVPVFDLGYLAMDGLDEILHGL